MQKLRRSKDMQGLKFGRWTVMYPGTVKGETINGEIRKHIRFWVCRCDCGTIREISGATLRSGKSLSCGCLMIEVNTKRMTKHGYTTNAGAYRRVYTIWQSMINRTTNKNHISSKRYFGKLDDESWRDFRNFLADMG